MFTAVPSSGWSVLSNAGGDFNDRFAVGGASYAKNAGGSTTHSHSQMQVPTSGASYDQCNRNLQPAVVPPYYFANNGHTHAITWPFSDADNSPPYTKVFFAKRNSMGLADANSLEFNSELDAAQKNAGAGVAASSESRPLRQSGLIASSVSFDSVSAAFSVFLVLIALFAFALFSSARRKTRRGQLLSVDFLIAVSLVAVCLGVLLQFNEATTNRALASAALANNEAESIAALLRAGKAVPQHAVYCAQQTLSNGLIKSVRGDCSSFSCGGRAVFAARRLSVCEDDSVDPPVMRACVLEVKSC
jgi:hypothetical protein